MKRRTTTRTSRKRQKEPADSWKTKRYDGRKSFRRIQGPGLTIINNVSAAPDRLMVKLKYSEIVSFSPAAAEAGTTYVVNSLQDPQGGGGVRRPAATNQWLAFYERYKVYGVAWKIWSGYTGAVGFMHGVLYPDSGNTLAATVEQALQQPRAKYLGLHAIASRYAEKNRGYWSTAEVYGVTNEQVRDDDVYSGTASVDPTRPFHIHLAFRTGDGVTNITAQVYIEFIMYTEFYDRLTLPLSTDS